MKGDLIEDDNIIVTTDTKSLIEDDTVATTYIEILIEDGTVAIIVTRNVVTNVIVAINQVSEMMIKTVAIRQEEHP